MTNSVSPKITMLGVFNILAKPWLPELGMYYYRARMYSPTLGRFLQTDPIGYHGGMNLYAYVGNDPVNFSGPLGLDASGRCREIETTWVHIVWSGPGPNPTPPGKITDKWVVANTLCENPGDATAHEFSHNELILVTGERPPVILASEERLPPGYDLYPNSNRQMMYRRGDPARTPVMTPRRQLEICDAYDRIMRSNAEVAVVPYGYGLFGLIARTPFGAYLNAVVGGVTVIFALKPPPPG